MSKFVWGNRNKFRSINFLWSNFVTPDLYLSHEKLNWVFSPMKARGKFGLKPKRTEMLDRSLRLLSGKLVLCMCYRNLVLLLSSSLAIQGLFIYFSSVMLDNLSHYWTLLCHFCQTYLYPPRAVIELRIKPLKYKLLLHLLIPITEILRIFMKVTFLYLQQQQEHSCATDSLFVFRERKRWHAHQN